MTIVLHTQLTYTITITTRVVFTFKIDISLEKTVDQTQISLFYKSSMFSSIRSFWKRQ